MYRHLLEDRSYYEDRYDRHTVEGARQGIVYYEGFYTDLESKLPEDDKIDQPRNAVLLNIFYMQTVGNELLYRYENRERYIQDWMARDEAKDKQIATARLAEEPQCQHCDKLGLRIIDKSLMHREEDAKDDDPEEVMFVLHCPHCDKNSAFWEDGTAWKVKPTLCPICKTEMNHKSTKSKLAITLTYKCPSCGHSDKDKIDLRVKKEKPDPNYVEDRVHYCLVDKEFRDKLLELRRGLERMAALGKEFKEHEDNKHIYDAIEEMKKPKIAELSTMLTPPLEKAGYVEFSLEKPDMGKDVFVGFSCLDNRSGRSDYDSKATLKKTIEKVLADTNWRLMSDGISYRLGYLSGRLRAYEREEDVKQLIIKSRKIKPKQESNDVVATHAYTIKGKGDKDIIL